MSKLFAWLFPNSQAPAELRDAVHRHSLASNSCRATMAVVQDSAIDHAQVKHEETRHLKKLAKESGEHVALKHCCSCVFMCMDSGSPVCKKSKNAVALEFTCPLWSAT